MRLLNNNKAEFLSVDQTYESQLLLNQRSQLCGRVSIPSRSAFWKPLEQVNKQRPFQRIQRELTCLSSCMRSFMIPETHCNFLQFPLSVWCARWWSSGAESDAMERDRTGRGCASIGGGSPPSDARMVGPLYGAGWRAVKVRRGLPLLTHYIPTTSFSVRISWYSLEATDVSNH